MKNRSLLYLSIAVAVAAAVWFLERPDRPKNLSTVESVVLFNALDASKAEKMVVADTTGSVELKKDGEGWKVVSGERSDPANGAKVKAALDAVAGLEVKTVASINPSRHEELRVGPSALQVTLFDANEASLARLYIGKGGPDPVSTYVRKDGDDVAYLVYKVLSPTFPVDPEKWKEEKPAEIKK